MALFFAKEANWKFLWLGKKTSNVGVSEEEDEEFIASPVITGLEVKARDIFG